MALPDTNFIAFQGVETYFVDKDTGLPLAGGYVRFYSDSARTDPNGKDVYQQVQLSNNTYEFVNIGNTVTLTSVGTFGSPDDGTDIQVYAFPFAGTVDAPGEPDLYYMEVYSSDDVLQFTREAQPANAFGSADSSTFESTANQVTNPEFAEILFTEDPATGTYVISVSADAEVDIAPGWTVVIGASASGTVTLQQIQVSNSAIIGNPSYALQVSSAGSITSITLRQRFEASPRLFADGFVASTLLAATIPNGQSSVGMTYSMSSGDSVDLIPLQLTTSTGVLSVLSDTVSTEGLINTDTAPDGYVDLLILIEPLKTVQISNIQMIQVESEGVSAQYIQQSNAQQENQLFYYYKPQLIDKPIPSYAVGWDFPFNPCQELGTTVTTSDMNLGAVNKSRYIADQTIAFQAVDDSLSFAFSTASGLTAATANTTQWALVQYLDTATARELLKGRMAVRIKGNTTGAALRGHVNLYWNANTTLPTISASTYNSLIATMVDGVPATFNGPGTWNTVQRSGLGDAVFSLPLTTAEEFSFSGWDGLDAGTNSTPINGGTTAAYFAIVVSFEGMPATTTAVIEYITLCHGDIATAPAPLSAAQTLQALQYYYETTYNANVRPATATNAGVVVRDQIAANNGGSTSLYAKEWGVEFNTAKCTAPAITIYSEAGTSNNFTGYAAADYANVQGPTNVSVSNYSSPFNISQKSFSATAANANPLVTRATAITSTAFAYLSFHYVADARLGTF